MPTQNVGGTALTDISGYRVIYGTSPTSLTKSAQVPGAATTSYVVDGLSAGIYYFAVITLNSAGSASSASNIASKTIQ